MANLPLSGMRILDLTAVWAGPHCTMLLCDWGAEVIRVESTQVYQPNTRGHMAKVPQDLPRIRKGWGSMYPDWTPGVRPWNRYPVFQSHARNKLSMTADMRRPEGRAVFMELLKTADAVIENNVPETIEKLHVTYEEIVHVRPDLVMVRMPAYGLSGQYKNFRSFGMQLEGTTGHTWIRGYPDMDASMRDDTFFGDAAAGVVGAYAALLALRHRQRTGQGQLVELAQAENFIPYLGEAVMDYILNKRVHSTLGNRHHYAAPQGVYRCKGVEEWLTLTVNNDAEWRAFCEVIGRSDLLRDPRFATAIARYKNQDDLDPQIELWTQVRTPWEAAKALQAKGVPAGPVLKDLDLVADPQMEVLDYFKELTHLDTGTHKYPGLMWSAAETPNELRAPPCRLGEHNPWVYKELLAVSDGEYRALEETGHIGMDYAPHVP
jgi:crotonobetainyl-CoA:carnitine CoA-transferase CaiB-like acyl-CoA transferase